MAYQPAPAVSSGWYLRGDVGVGIQTFGDFPHSQTNSAFVWPASWAIVQKDLQDTTIFGGGVGYEWNNWFRTDITAEYRTKAAFKATGSYTNFCAGGGVCFDVTQGNFSSAVFMANAYLDLGTWWCLTPYIGAGLGSAYNRITGVQDNGINSDGTVGFGLRPRRTRRIGILPGMPRPASPTTSTTTSRSISAPATCIWARRRRPWWPVRIHALPRRLLQSEQHQFMGFQDRPALDAAARYGPGDGGPAADEPGLMPSATTAKSKATDGAGNRAVFVLGAPGDPEPAPIRMRLAICLAPPRPPELTLH